MVAVEQRDSIITRCFSGVEELELHMAGVQVGRFEYRTIVTNVACVEDKKALLEHCCPVVATGQIAEQNMEHFNAFFSHSSEPNCDQHCARFTAQQFRQGPVNIISTQYLLYPQYQDHGDPGHLRGRGADCELRPERGLRGMRRGDNNDNNNNQLSLL